MSGSLIATIRLRLGVFWFCRIRGLCIACGRRARRTTSLYGVCGRCGGADRSDIKSRFYVTCRHGCTVERTWYDCSIHGAKSGREMCPVRVAEDSAGIYRTRCTLVVGHEGGHV